MAGTRDTVKGKLKQATGILIGDKKLEREGKLDEAVGTVKDTVGKVVDKVRDAVTPGKPSLKRRAKRAAKSLE
jgi:uncharacterized protein YjbJ (UPF0337 family)